MTSTLSPCEALKTHINDPPKPEKDTTKQKPKISPLHFT